MNNILICESGGGYGGSAAYLYSFLRYLNKDAFHPIVLFYQKAEGPFVKNIEELNVETAFLSSNQYNEQIKYKVNRYARHIIDLIKYIESACADIIRLIYFIKKKNIALVLLNQDVVFHLPVIIASTIIRIPCIVRKGGVGTYQGNKMWKFLARFPQAFVASSNAEYQFHTDSGFPYKKMVVIFEGVDVDSFHPGPEGQRIRSEFGIAPDIPVVGSISRIDNGKGLEDFINTASLILRDYPETIFLIVGDGDDVLKKKLLGQVRSLGIQDKVIFTGWRNDTTDILKAIDIFVHCPNLWREGMGIATLEAMASGKPVVITDNWGLSDTTQDGYNGFKVSIGSSKEIAEKIVILIKDKELRTRMGMNSRSRALQLFDLKINIRKIEDIMRESLHAPMD